MFGKLGHALRYLFYRSYIHQLGRWKGDAGTAAVAATGLIALALFININTVLILVLSALRKRLPSEITIADGLPSIKVAYMAVAGVLVLAQALYLFYTRNGRDREIVKEYSTEDPPVRRQRTLYIYIYTIFTVALFVISLIIATFSAQTT